ncbi:thiamine pyrophosphate-dependent enzyme [Streptomyces sp. NPDC051677]|uniref:thiamine pyrophosphate-dependent enzyme n=1 Tax=Streptomyces sp. NPDC051677 TaxID=3365669 RepID=UPI0037CFA0F6
MTDSPAAASPTAEEPLRLLGLDGTPDGTGGSGLPVPDEPLDLRAAYRDMVLARRFDTEAIALQRQGELGLWPSMLGQEGAQVGAAHALRAQDMVFPTYREHAVLWCRGVDPVHALALFRGTTLGGWEPAEHRFALYTIVLGAQTLHAVGFAMGIVRDGRTGTGDPDTDRAVLVFVGDGALSEGETNEAFVWAGAQRLPVVFFCQNNQWAISTPYRVQSRVPAARRAGGFGFDGVRVDGNDVLACHAVTRAALEKARAGGGPTLIEAVTYRRNPHTTSDDDRRYRTADDNDHWAALDPVLRLRAHLESPADPVGRAPVPHEEFLAALAAEEEALAARLRSGCRGLASPPPNTPFLHTLARPTRHLEAQMREHLAFVESGESA